MNQRHQKFLYDFIKFHENETMVRCPSCNAVCKIDKRKYIQCCFCCFRPYIVFNGKPKIYE
jgi:uncharacterized C2H2 Zn-finger protein